MAQNGVVFGSTILAEGVTHTFLSRRVLGSYNKHGVFTNIHDDLDGLRRILREEFSDHRIEVQGSVALFTAWLEPTQGGR